MCRKLLFYIFKTAVSACIDSVASSVPRLPKLQLSQAQSADRLKPEL